MAMNMHILRKGIEFIRRQKKPFKINMLRASFTYFLVTLVIYYQSIYIIALGATPFQLGLTISIGGIAGVAVTLPTGWFVDRHGVKKIFLLGTLAVSIGAMCLAFASNWITAIPGVLMTILGLTLVETVCPVVCSSCLKNEERATGMQLCDTIVSIPRLIAPMMGAVLVTSFGGISVNGIKPLYLLQFFGFCLIFLFILKFFSDPFEVKQTKKEFNLFKDIGEIFDRGRMVKRWILYNIFSHFAYYIAFLGGFVALYAHEIKGADQYVLGVMASTLMIIPITLALVVGKLADIFGRKKMLFTIIPLYCVSLVILILAYDSTTLIISSILQGFYMLYLTTEGALSAELVPVDLLGRWWGLLALTRGMIGIFAPIIAGQLWILIGPSSIFIFIIGTQLALIPLLMTMPETLLLHQS